MITLIAKMQYVNDIHVVDLCVVNVIFSSIPETPFLQTTLYTLGLLVFFKRKLRPIRLRAFVCIFTVYVYHLNVSEIIYSMSSKFPCTGVQYIPLEIDLSQKRAILSIHFNNLIVAIDCEYLVKHAV